MANMMDYLNWRGDLPFSFASFNEVDNLILATLSYVRFDGIVPGPAEGEILLSAAAEACAPRCPEEKEGASFEEMAPRLLRACGLSLRFAGALLKNYVNHFDAAREIQFSALEITLPDGVSYISFRGTDSTIVGWKEDFYLSVGVVPAQKEAVSYLDTILRDRELSEVSLYLGGHSKGGNLAEYAAASCGERIRERILRVFNNDGPGFSEDFIRSDGYRKIAPKISLYVPSFGIIGELMRHGAARTVVDSTEKSVMAHDPFSWEVTGTGFDPAPGIDKKAEFFNQSLDSWISSMQPDSKRAFIDDLFAVLEAPGVLTLREISGGGLPVLTAMLRRLAKLEPETQKIISSLMRILFENFGEFARTALEERILEFREKK